MSEIDVPDKESKGDHEFGRSGEPKGLNGQKGGGYKLSTTVSRHWTQWSHAMKSIGLDFTLNAEFTLKVLRFYSEFT